MTNFFSNLWEVISTCFAIAIGKRLHASTRQKAKAILLLVIVLASMLVSGYYIWTATSYTMLSAIKHFAVLRGEQIGWNYWFTGSWYEMATAAKENLISTNQLAEFFDSWNVNALGKTVQVVVLLIGTGMFFFILAAVFEYIMDSDARRKKHIRQNANNVTAKPHTQQIAKYW